MVRFGMLVSTFFALTHATSSSTHYTNCSSPTSTPGKTSTSNLPSSITSCATLSQKDFFAASLRSLPDAEFASITSSEFVKIQEVVRVFLRYYAGGGSDPALLAYITSLYTSVQDDVTSLLGPSGYAYLNFQSITNGCLLSTCVNQFISVSSSFAVASPSDLFFFTAKPPCCQQCTVSGAGVELAYWPTPAPTPPITALIDVAANFTFVSPSVYAFFTSLQANNLCGPVGGVYPFVGFKFGPTDLSTSSILVNPSLSLTEKAPNQWTAINYADFGTQCICTTNCQIDPLYNTTLSNLCTPQLSLPAIVTEFDPAWSTCVSNFEGVFDPPIALQPAAGLTTPKNAPAQSTPGGGGGTTPPAGPTPAPVNGPSAPIPIPTPTPQPQPSTQPPASINSPIPASQSTNLPPPPANTPPANPQPENSQPANPPPVNSPAPVPTLQSSPTPAAPAIPAPITIANTVLTPLPGPSSIYIVNSQTLIPGGSPITVNGATISLSPSGSPIILGNPGPAPTTPPSLTINGQVITANAQSNYVIGTQTLIPGCLAITVSGTAISLAPGATQIVVGGSTASLGSIIMSVFNGETSPSTGKTETSLGGGTKTGVAPAQFTGGVAREGENVIRWVVWVGFTWSILMWL